MGTYISRSNQKSNTGRLFLSVLLLFAMSYAYSQAPKKMSHADSVAYRASIKTVHIIHADRISSMRGPDSTVFQTMAGKVSLRQEGTHFTCDSLILNTVTSMIEAFGHVHIKDAQKTTTQSDYLRYTGADKKAYLSGHVIMKDPSVTLTTPDMDYDMATHTATYGNGGKIVNGKTVLNSQRGTYYGQTHDAQFDNTVRLVDPKYKINTESLLYNTESKKATFTVPTVITDGKNKKIETSDGYYDLKTRQAYFGKRPTIIDSTSTLIADEVASDEASGFGEARGNVIFKDSAQGLLLVSGNLKTNRDFGALLATINPVAIIKQGENDSLFVGGDTLFSGKLSERMKTEDSSKIRVGSIYLPERIADTSGKVIRPVIELKSLPKITKSSQPDSSASSNKEIVDGLEQHKKQIDSIRSSPHFLRPKTDVQNVGNMEDSASLPPHAKNDSSGIPFSSVRSDTLIKTDSLIASGLELIKKDSVAVHQADTVLPVKTEIISPTQKAVSTKHKKSQKQRVITAKRKSVTDTNGQQQDDNDRYFEVYSHVKIFSDSMQAAGDSLFYSFKDSLFRLYKNPIVWTKDNQLTGDTIYLFTQNKKPKRILVSENAIAVNKVDTVSTHLFYNQIKGRIIDAKFTGGEIDSLKSKGSAESIYYMLDDNNKFIGINKSSSDVIDMYFKTRQPQKIVFRVKVVGTATPLSQMSAEDSKLKGFLLQENRRPKSKYDLLSPPSLEQKPPAEGK